jgi:uncharacterized repeat protein (TIGR02543 family)
MKKLLLTLIFILALGFSYAQQSNHWTTITGTQYNLTMSGVISIDDVTQTSTALEIGAFYGNECRGSARAQYFPPTGDYVVSLTVVSNQQSGEAITFRLYDHATQQEFPTECVNNITFNANDNYGEMGNWYPFAFVGEVPEYEITVSANPVEGGTVSGAGTYSEGDLCTLTVMVNDAYTFVNWTKDGIEVSTSPTCSFTVTESASYTANFIEASTANHWTTIVGTQYNLTMSGVISIDGIAQTSTALEIGAFCGNECRGSARAQFFPPTGDYVVSLTVVSNEVNGETITFRLYDHRIQQEFPTECINSIIFDANSNFGEMGNWYPFAFVENANTTQTVTLSAGWNWFSSYIEVENPVAMLQAIETSLGENGVEIRNSHTNTEYDSEWGWWGDLDEEGIVNEQMYKILVSSPCTITLEGTPANPAEHPITINPGWNWIGFPSETQISLEVAFDGFAQEGDRIRNSGTQIEYDPDWGWFGDFETLEAGQGYMYYSASSTPRTLVFPSAK